MSISKVGLYAFYNHPNLERAVVSAPVIETNAFQASKKLEVVDLTSEAEVSIAANAFNGCSNLTHLIIRSAARSALSAISALNSTKIMIGDGGVYVPANLLDSYKGATNWSTIAENIFPIGEYPKAYFDTISDSWTAIFANTNYATAYTIKDTKTLELIDGTKIKMDLVALDTDVKSDNSGKAKMTWICHGIPYQRVMSSSNSTYGGWASSEMRSWLISDILSKIPTEIKSHIVSVKKSYRTRSPNDETLWSDDEIWIPSCTEIGITKTQYTEGLGESDGIFYSDYFSPYVSKKTLNSNSVFWLRTAYNSSNFLATENEHYCNYSRPAFANGVVFGFCTD